MTKALPAIPGFEHIATDAGIGHNNPPSPIDLEALKELNPETLYKHDEYEQVLKELEAEADKFVPDVSSKAGREAITSMAYALTRCRTILDDKGKAANEELNKQVKDTNTKRTTVKSRLDAKITKIKKPLLDIEAAEAKEKARIENAFAILRENTTFFSEPSIENIDARLNIVEQLKDFDWGDDPEQKGKGAYARAKLELMDKRAGRVKQIADAQELERLRIAELERAAKAEAPVIVTTTPTNEDSSHARQAFASEHPAGYTNIVLGPVLETFKNDDPAVVNVQPVSNDARKNFEDQKAKELERQRVINGAAVRGLMDACPFLMQEQAKNIVRAIIGKQVPNVTINYGEKQ